MGPKTMVVISWGVILMGLQLLISGEGATLLHLITTPNSQSQAPNGGLILLLIGEAGFITILSLISETGNDGSNFALTLLGGITLVFMVFNGPKIAQWGTQLGV